MRRLNFLIAFLTIVMINPKFPSVLNQRLVYRFLIELFFYSFIV